MRRHLLNGTCNYLCYQFIYDFKKQNISVKLGLTPVKIIFYKTIDLIIWTHFKVSNFYFVIFKFQEIL